VSSHLLDPLVQSIGWALIHFIWQGTLIGGAIALVLRVIGGHRPAIRYVVACAGLGLLLLAPLSTVFTTGNAGSAQVATVARVSQDIVTAVSMDRILPVAVVSWMFGVVLLSIRLVAASVGIERMKRATRDVDRAVSQRLHVLAERLGVSRPVQVFVSTVVRVPTVVGYIRPVILIPVSVITGLPAAHLDTVLAHELAHVRRHDYLVNVLQAIVETLLFYHPAVWWCSRQIRIEREHCCDDLVVEACGDRVGYATALAQLEELRGLEPMLSVNATGGRLIDRIRRVLGHAQSRERGSTTTWTMVAALTLVVTAMIITPVMTSADAETETVASQVDFTLPEPLPEPPEPLLEPPPAPPMAPTPPVAPLAPMPPVRPLPQSPQAAAPAAPAAPTTPAPPAPPVPPSSQAAAPAAPTAPAPPAPPAPLLPRAAQPALPALPVPPAPPAPPADDLQIDPESIAAQMRRATEQLTRSFDDLRRATQEIIARQEALHQAEAELVKMRLETLAKNTQLEAMRRSMAELSAAMNAEQLGQLKEEALRKQLEAVRKQIDDLRAR
jgi:beta-lactamase regulating signal transducer with metallopeptidase domain